MLYVVLTMPTLNKAYLLLSELLPSLFKTLVEVAVQGPWAFLMHFVTLNSKIFGINS